MTTGNSNQLQFYSFRVTSSDEIKGNFVRLPSSIVQTLESTGIAIQEFGITISKEGKELLHLGWDGYESHGLLDGQPTIDINTILAKEVNLHVGMSVDLTVRKYDETQTATEVYVEPDTSDDWEIIESHAMFFQDEILHQTRIVTLGETLLCYVDNTVSKFKVKKLTPDPLRSARIGTGSLIIVAPRENKWRMQRKHTKNDSRKLSTSNRYAPSCNSFIKRSIHFTDPAMNDIKIWLHPDEVKSEFAYVSILQNSLDSQHNAKQDKPLKYSKKIAVVAESSGNISKEHIMLSSLVWDSLCVVSKNGCKVQVEFFSEDDHNLNPKNVSVILRPISDEADSAKVERHKSTQPLQSPPQHVIEFVSRISKSVLTDKMAFVKERIFLELITDGNGKHVHIANFHKKSLSGWKYSTHDKIKLALPLFTQDMKKNSFISQSLNVEVIMNDLLVDQICQYLTLPVTPSSCLVLEGNAGMGKTTILREVTKELTLKHLKYVKYVDCDSLIDSSNMGKMKQLIQDWCSSCYWYSPSVLLLDNAASLFPSIKSDDPQQQTMSQRGGSTATKLALFLVTMVETISKKSSNAIRIIITTQNTKAINTAFFDKHFICETFKRKPPDKYEREKILKFLFEKSANDIKLSAGIEFRDIALETDGYSPLDLEILVDKLFYESTMDIKHDIDNFVVTKDMFTETIKGFERSSLRGVKLTKGTGVSWNDIGALKGPKRLLLETLEWPTKYAPIFKQSPLQLRSGVLLYGYPGCGKTLLASAVAQQCGLNFINVKGPEILNKYIGASEQNVRELFDRAQSVKPCVLFFDEFDSIAPKRGHDSTGVTDRIVNQLLTQMDGVEGLDGVYVLAATSRPDLIDSALLRPGRIDKSIICNIPDANDRYDILRAVTGKDKMNLSPNTDIQIVARKTAGYSGADLQGLCYNAYLKAVHRLLHSQNEENKVDSSHARNTELEFTVMNGKSESAMVTDMLDRIQEGIADTTDETRNTENPTVTITINDLLEACEETKPSISSSELFKLQAIYNKFQNDRDGNMPSGENSNDIGTRTSLM